MSASDTDKTLIEVEPFSGWQFISFKELWHHKELFYFFIILLFDVLTLKKFFEVLKILILNNFTSEFSVHL